MTISIDVLQLIPEIAAIGQSRLQGYCDAWLLRPLAKHFGVAQLFIDDQLMLTVNLDSERAQYVGDNVVIPIDELLAYIIDTHFEGRDERQQLQRTLRDIKKQIGETGHDYEASIGRMGSVYLVCRSCAAIMTTSHRAAEGQVIECPPCEIACPLCGAVGVYDGADLRVDSKS